MPGAMKRGRADAGAEDSENVEFAPALRKERGSGSGVRCGVGIVVRDRNSDGLFQITRVKEGQSAQQSGRVYVGDTVLAVNGRDAMTVGTLEELAQAISGPQGTYVDLKVRHTSGQEEEIRLQRQLPVPDRMMGSPMHKEPVAKSDDPLNTSESCDSSKATPDDLLQSDGTAIPNDDSDLEIRTGLEKTKKDIATVEAESIRLQDMLNKDLFDRSQVTTIDWELFHTENSRFVAAFKAFEKFQRERNQQGLLSRLTGSTVQWNFSEVEDLDFHAWEGKDDVDNFEAFAGRFAPSVAPSQILGCWVKVDFARKCSRRMDGLLDSIISRVEKISNGAISGIENISSVSKKSIQDVSALLESQARTSDSLRKKAAESAKESSTQSTSMKQSIAALRSKVTDLQQQLQAQESSSSVQMAAAMAENARNNDRLKEVESEFVQLKDDLISRARILQQKQHPGSSDPDIKRSLEMFSEAIASCTASSMDLHSSDDDLVEPPRAQPNSRFGDVALSSNMFKFGAGQSHQWSDDLTQSQIHSAGGKNAEFLKTNEFREQDDGGGNQLRNSFQTAAASSFTQHGYGDGLKYMQGKRL